MNRSHEKDALRFGLPKGHIAAQVDALIRAAGISISPTERSYRPSTSLPDCEVKVLKLQNIVEMLHIGRRDVGFAGADWVAELSANVVEVLDTGLDAVDVVAAGPAEGDPLADGEIVVATEYVELAWQWTVGRGVKAEIVRSYGATEVFPPEDADVVACPPRCEGRGARFATRHYVGRHVECSAVQDEACRADSFEGNPAVHCAAGRRGRGGGCPDSRR